jgi:hypothetical protein
MNCLPRSPFVLSVETADFKCGYESETHGDYADSGEKNHEGAVGRYVAQVRFHDTQMGMSGDLFEGQNVSDFPKCDVDSLVF